MKNFGFKYYLWGPQFLTGLTILFLLILHPQVAQAAGRIAYSHLTDGYWQIWTMNTDGSDPKQSTFSKIDKRDPAWVERGKRIAFRTSNAQFFILDLATGNEQRFLEKYGIVSNPSYSEKTNEVIFIRFDSRIADATDIWKVSLEGEDARLLTKDNYSKIQPDLSADGGQIAFVRSDALKKFHQIWTMDSDGEKLRQITRGSWVYLQPQFSPDNTALTYTSDQDGNFNVYWLDLDQLDEKRLTDAPGLDADSSFSPDGQTIVFVSNRGGNQQIWKMGLDGSNLMQLTHGDNEAVDPDWVETGEGD